MSNIPKARKRIDYALDLIKHLDQVLRDAYTLTYRAKAVSKTKVKSNRMTKEIAKQIRYFKKINPEASLQEIAYRYQVNQGRVSEALRGKRKWA